MNDPRKDEFHSNTAGQLPSGLKLSFHSHVVIFLLTGAHVHFFYLVSGSIDKVPADLHDQSDMALSSDIQEALKQQAMARLKARLDAVRQCVHTRLSIYLGVRVCA